MITICSGKLNSSFSVLNAVLWIFEYLRIFSNQLEGEKKSPLRNIVLSKLSYILEPILKLLSSEEEEIRKAAFKTNDQLLKIMDKVIILYFLWKI